jgi:hypothetical protein
MSRLPSLAAVLAAVTLAAACGPGDPPTPTPGPGDGGGDVAGGDPSGGDGGAGAGGGTDATATLALTFDPQPGPDGIARVDLEVVGVALFTDREPSYVDADTPCDANGAGTLHAVVRTVPLDLSSPARTEVASFELPGTGSLLETWLVLRQGLLPAGDRTYKIHNGAMCVMPDGLQYTLVRLRPGPVSLEGGADSDLLVRFDFREEVTVERVNCRARHVEECDTSDDPDDDRNGNTRLRFSFATEFPVRVERRAPR